MIVADRRNVLEALSAILDGLAIEVVPVTTATARDVASAYQRFGKGVHPAA